jgi:DNA (cytosine-5)-methyltransferase 1
MNYLCDIREMVTKARNHELEEELYNLDILDGSPPCSSFSTAGNRDDDWGKEKKFREGQTSQVLDTLFFDFIDLAKELQPKIVIAENVKGLTLGSAKSYITRIYQEFDDANYLVCHRLLNASSCGVPQQRERVFFLAIRKDFLFMIPNHQTLFYYVPEIDLHFTELGILLSEFSDFNGRELVGKCRYLWEKHLDGEHSLDKACLREFGKASYFCEVIAYQNEICPTLTSQGKIHHHDKPLFLSKNEVCCISTFPQDFDFVEEKPEYICGMSVPPVMMAQVASRVYDQWLSKLPK